MYLELTPQRLDVIRHNFPNTCFSKIPDHILNYVWGLVDKHKLNPTRVCIAGGVFWKYREDDVERAKDLVSNAVMDEFHRLKDIDVFVYDPEFLQVKVGEIDGYAINFDYTPDIPAPSYFDFYPAMVHMLYRSDIIYFPEDLLYGKLIRRANRRLCAYQRRLRKYIIKGFPFEREVSLDTVLSEACTCLRCTVKRTMKPDAEIIARYGIGLN